MTTTTTPAIDAPRSPKEPHKLRSRRTSRTGRTNFELYSWLFMRFSGLLLTVLVLGHLFIMLVLDGGVEKINFAFVAGRWASPFWQIWDLLTLWLATLHGTNGLRTVINDYAERDGTRFVLKSLLYFAAIVMIFLGSLVIFTFDPSIKA
ncbi:succinate dehydrogenase, hydrophobic membrane anchor protein [Actinospica sp.]|jgi:succinate dehydrogenase / fumarate reductase membrane anchor subunit|uniref:succinate dehydrogenase, hydrophobic membrane anchor protein n=1 Tax=Actinospica sp. TaxID=1872142 RepID=UPI002C39CB32|nr:succinate dehydrogenase, hydrophobic membrane anchor protein [Actinospica sp.]HWG23859.1 succinate dehydrogenase, hydrophobic membrane anchor protein [Actinospica sp.]